MKINNYYNLPSVQCKSRINLINSFHSLSDEKKKEFCKGINPDNVYDTLYPGGFPSSEYGSPEALEDYYKKYKKFGKEGDYFCSYAYNKCLPKFVVGKKGQKIIPKESKKKNMFLLQQYVYQEIVYQKIFQIMKILKE